MSKEVVHAELALVDSRYSDRKEEAVVFTKPGAVDDAGYKSLAELVSMFRRAGQQHDIFQAADFEGELDVNPLHRVYVDRVDQDRAVAEAIEAGRKARADYDSARRAYLDRVAQERENEIARVQEKIRRNRNAKTQREPSLPQDGAQEED